MPEIWNQEKGKDWKEEGCWLFLSFSHEMRVRAG